MTQTGAGEQFNVCADGTQVPLISTCASGLIPTYFYSFKAELPGYVLPIRGVPEPMSVTLFGAGLLGLAAARRRRRC